MLLLRLAQAGRPYKQAHKIPSARGAGPPAQQLSSTRRIANSCKACPARQQQTLEHRRQNKQQQDPLTCWLKGWRSRATEETTRPRETPGWILIRTWATTRRRETPGWTGDKPGWTHTIAAQCVHACERRSTSRVLRLGIAYFARTSRVLRAYFARTSPVLRMYFARAVHVLRAYSARTSHVLRVHFSSSSLVLRPYFAIHVPVHAWNLRARRLCFGCMSCAFSTSPILRFYFGRTSLVFCTCLARASPTCRRNLYNLRRYLIGNWLVHCPRLTLRMNVVNVSLANCPSCSRSADVRPALRGFISSLSTSPPSNRGAHDSLSRAAWRSPRFRPAEPTRPA